MSVLSSLFGPRLSIEDKIRLQHSRADRRNKAALKRELRRLLRKCSAQVELLASVQDRVSRGILTPSEYDHAVKVGPILGEYPRDRHTKFIFWVYEDRMVLQIQTSFGLGFSSSSVPDTEIGFWRNLQRIRPTDLLRAIEAS